MKNLAARLSLCGLCLSLMLPSIGCEAERITTDPGNPPPTFTGPEFLHTTVGSMCALQGYQPTLVAGYGLVAKLHGTGSADVPPALRQYMLQELARGGFGRIRYDMGQLTPQRVLASQTTAVVLVQGIVPPGALPGQKFDLYVSALPQTQTTSLAHGVLYTSYLYPNSPVAGRTTANNVAEGGGPVFTNPFAKRSTDSINASGDERTARVLGGGTVVQPTQVRLRLNQPSYGRARAIADRINARIPQSPDDPRPTADPKSDVLIHINIPSRYKGNTEHLLGLISHLFLNAGNSFNQRRARAMVSFLEDPANHRYAQNVAYVWEGMGKLILPILREHYNHPDFVVRTTALKVGARLGDTRTAEPIYRLAVDAGVTGNEEAAELLAHLLRLHPRHTEIRDQVRSLLNATDSAVRLAAVEGLLDIGDASVNVRHFGDKFDLLVARSDKPMVYVTRRGVPRIIIFDQDLPVRGPGVFVAYEGRLMLKTNDSGQLLARYQPLGRSAGDPERIPPTAANLVYLMGTIPQPGVAFGDRGFDMGYAEVVRVLQKLEAKGWLGGPFVLQSSDLVEQITRQRLQQTGGRPESDVLGRPEQDRRRPDGEKDEAEDDDFNLLGF